jgi:hypothetical protein
MKTTISARTFLVLNSILALSVLVPAMQAQPGVPATDFNGETNLQVQTRFLTFIGSFIGETPAVSRAYYNAINPSGSKQNVTAWLVNAGFIQSASEWNPSGPQLIACDLGAAAGCDMPTHDSSGNLNHGYGIINTDSHAIVLNAADLGFVRNQFVRCIDPSKKNNPTPCKGSNPIIYTYLENYPVAPFALTSGFPGNSGYLNQNEAAAAMQSAINRPAGVCPASGTAPGGGNCNPGASLQRIADVMFEWAPPETNPTSTSRFGQLYAYLVDPTNVASETLTFSKNVAAAANARPDFTLANPSFPPIETKTGSRVAFVGGDPILDNADYFAPELDGRGFKQHPTVCFICHGGKPTNLNSGGIYPRGGRVDGFRLLPLDIVNLNFTSASGGEQPALNGSKAYTDRDHQQLQIKEYNKVVLLTVDQSPVNDGTGATRSPHLATVVNGWYAPNFSSPTQNSSFVPSGWTGFETLYTQTVGPSCRSCHFNREISLDFGTVANFDAESDILQLALLPQCKSGNPSGSADYMPLAHLTFLRYWQTQASAQPLDFGNILLNHEPDRLASHFGFGSVAGYCAKNP